MSMGKMTVGVLSGLLAAGAVAAAVTIPDSVKEIEVHFFDSENKDKKIKFSIDSLSASSLEIHRDNKWTKENTGDDKKIYEALFDIASKYLKIQNSLNLIKTSSKNFEDFFKNLCQDPSKCCCKAAGGKASQCDCKNNKCATCLCCYLDNGQCCSNGKSCNGDQFKKTQRTFAYLLKNIDSGYHNSYLTPIQAYIKLPENKFNDLKNELKDEKTLIASLAYGFSDYSYKPIKYKGTLPKEKANDYESLTEGKSHYFANIPQSLLFGKKEGQTETNIEEVLKKMEGTEQIKALIDKDYSTTSGDCCKDKNLDCLIKRNFMFLESQSGDTDEGLTNISNKIKNAEDCCKGAAS